MIWFLTKGLLRDRHRSLFPVIVVVFGVMLTTLIYSYINGEMNDLIDSNARFDTGHLKVITRALNESAGQSPNSLSLTNVYNLTKKLGNKHPDYDWPARIRFTGIIDVPDENGETKTQSPVAGLAIDILSKSNNEIKRLRLDRAIVNGHVPEKPFQILISQELANRSSIKIGQSVTLLSTTATGSLAVQNFTVCGTVIFGVAGMDNGAMIADISDMQYTLDMTDCASEILGFSKDGFYHSNDVEHEKLNWNNLFKNSDDQFSPVMQTLEDQNGLGEWLSYVRAVGFLIIAIFITAMSIVLLNTGLMSGIRRYGEVGVRIALGESKDMIYISILVESILVGCIGSIIGTALGLAEAYYLQEIGIDISGTLRNSSIMMPNILRAKINFTSCYIGFIPGFLATIIGTTFSGIQIYQRQTASLFKELES